MRTTTTATRKITVPISATWVCSNCGASMFKEGEIVCQASASSSAFSKEKRERVVLEKSKEELKAKWLDQVLGVIFDPIKHYKDVRECLHIRNCWCPICHKKEKWYRGIVYQKIAGYLAFCALFTLLVLVRWLFDPEKEPLTESAMFWALPALILSLVGIACCVFSHFHFKSVLEKIPKESMPLIGTSVPEIILCAKSVGKHLYTPEEVQEIAIRNAQKTTEDGLSE